METQLNDFRQGLRSKRHRQAPDAQFALGEYNVVSDGCSFDLCSQCYYLRFALRDDVADKIKNTEPNVTSPELGV